MKQKYEFTGETKNWNGHTVRRIRRISDGVIGGWIEKEDNLSHDGNCWVADNAIVCDDALVRENAQVYGNAKVYDNARISEKAEVYDNAEVYERGGVWKDSQVYGDAKVHGHTTINHNAQIYESAEIFGNANVSCDSKVHGKAQVSGKSNLWGDIEVYGNAVVTDNADIHGCNKIYGEARICDGAEIYGKANVYGKSRVCGSTKVYGNAKIYGDAVVEGESKVYGDAEVDSGVITGNMVVGSASGKLNEVDEQLKDFICKIEDSNKLKVQTSYESIDSFFADDSDNAHSENASICIVAVDTKMTLIKLEKVKVNDEKCYKFIVELDDRNGDDFMVRSVVNSKEKFMQVLQYVIDSLNNYPQFVAYADELDNCL